MGYFLDYDLFTPCWKCGLTTCNGNHPESVAEAKQLPHHKHGLGDARCTCHVCREMREREANRE